MTTLEILRSYHNRPEDVVVGEEAISFGGQSININTEVIKVNDESFNILQIWLLLCNPSKMSDYVRTCKEAKVNWIKGFSERKAVVNLFTGASSELPSSVVLISKRRLENAEKPPSKRQALESLLPQELSDDLVSAKEEFARTLEQCINNVPDVEIDKSNAFVMADEDITAGLRARERAMRSRNMVLCAPKQDLNISVDSIRKLLSGRPSSSQSRTSSNRHGNSSSSTVSKPSRKPKKFTPIIVVPKTGTSTLTIDNAVEFLKTGKLNLSVVSKRRSGKTIIHTLKHKMGEHEVSFEIRDSIIQLPKTEYHRIVSVFATGPAWQFTGPEWKKYEPVPSKLFQKVKGFYLCSDDKPVPESISNLDIKVLQVCFTKPYTVQRAQIYFWDELYLHLQKQEFAF